MPDAKGPNADQIAYWNASAGPTWVALQEIIEGWAAAAPRTVIR